MSGLVRVVADRDPLDLFATGDRQSKNDLWRIQTVLRAGAGHAIDERDGLQVVDRREQRLHVALLGRLVAVLEAPSPLVAREDRCSIGSDDFDPVGPRDFGRDNVHVPPFQHVGMDPVRRNFRQSPDDRSVARAEVRLRGLADWTAIRQMQNMNRRHLPRRFRLLRFGILRLLARISRGVVALGLGGILRFFLFGFDRLDDGRADRQGGRLQTVHGELLVPIVMPFDGTKTRDLGDHLSDLVGRSGRGGRLHEPLRPVLGEHV